MMSEMAERAATAMVGFPLSRLGDEDRAAWLASARLAIEAMREPTSKMVEAGLKCEHIDLASEWRAMIDAALKE